MIQPKQPSRVSLSVKECGKKLLRKSECAYHLSVSRLGNIPAAKSFLVSLFSNAPTDHPAPMNIPASPADFSVCLD